MFFKVILTKRLNIDLDMTILEFNLYYYNPHTMILEQKLKKNVRHIIYLMLNFVQKYYSLVRKFLSFLFSRGNSLIIHSIWIPVWLLRRSISEEVVKFRIYTKTTSAWLAFQFTPKSNGNTVTVSFTVL